MPGTDDIKFMQRCLELAAKAEGLTYPNPMVGSVIVHEGVIAGEGYHLAAGGPHAEVNAINSVKNADVLGKSTLYVNLEPCSHFGKTPPCADLIIKKGIPKVVIGTADTSDKVAGKGIAVLKAAGCDVVTGVLEKESRWLNRRFFTGIEKRRPYIILKWAQSSDGFIDVLRRGNDVHRPTWITGKAERVLVHKWRAAEQAILVGGGTVRADNPMLDVREWSGDNPMRIVLSRSGDTGTNAALFDRPGRVIVFTANKNTFYGNNVATEYLEDDIPAAVQVCNFLFQSGIQSLFVEGGAMVLDHFISAGLWDEARVFTGTSIFHNGVKAPAVKGALVSKTVYRSSILELFVNTGNQ